jgi:hypothetical protein
MKNLRFGILITSVAALGLTGLSLRENKAEVNLTANEYKVLTVQGRIIFEQTGKDMQRGDLYVTGTPLNFTSTTDRAAIINDVNGRYVLSSSKGKLKVLPAANNVSSRGGALLNIVDLKNHFSGRYLVIGKSKIQLSPESFPMNDAKFFYLTYEHDGEQINKKLSFETDNLILDATEIFKIDGNAIPVTEKLMTLYYKGDKTYKINSFTPVFAEEKELKEEVSILLETIHEKTNADKMNEVTAYLNEFYGNPAKENLAAWLKAEFGIE